MVGIASIIVYAVAMSKPKPPTPSPQEETEHLMDTVQATIEKNRGR
jgi:hypothetical protein